VGDTIEFVSPDDGDADMVLVVAGCSTACVDIEPFGSLPIRFIKSREEADTFIEEVKKRQGGS
jgi:tRNA G26 N,N-dimethylase Trm1